MNNLKIYFQGVGYELAFFPIMQLIGHESNKKRLMIECITNYFSASKTINTDSLSITIGDENVGRKYFDVTYISNLENLENALSLVKGSILHEYVVSKLNEFDFSEYHFAMEDLLNLIITTFNSTIEDSLGIELELKDYPIGMLIKTHLLLNDSDATSFEKYKILMQLIYEMNLLNPMKRLVVFENVDSYVMKSEYNELIEIANRQSHNCDIWFIFVTKDDSFITLDENLFQGVTIFNSEVIILPPLDVVKKYVEKNFPYLKEFNDDEFLEKIAPILGDVGMNVSPISIESQVILKILNNHYDVPVKPLEVANKLALEYMKMSSKML